MQSDADKVAEFRAFLRMRRSMPQEFGTYALRNFTRFLLKARCLICFQTCPAPAF